MEKSPSRYQPSKLDRLLIAGLKKMLELSLALTSLGSWLYYRIPEKIAVPVPTWRDLMVAGIALTVGFLAGLLITSC